MVGVALVWEDWILQERSILSKYRDIAIQVGAGGDAGIATFSFV